MDNFFVFIVRSLFLFRFFFSPVVFLLLCSTPRVESVLCVRYCVEVPFAVCVRIRHSKSKNNTQLQRPILYASEWMSERASELALYVYWYAVYWSGSGGKMDLVMEKTNATHSMYHLDVWRRKLENVNVVFFYFCFCWWSVVRVCHGKKARSTRKKEESNGKKCSRTQKESMVNPLSKNCEFFDFQYTSHTTLGTRSSPQLDSLEFAQ